MEWAHRGGGGQYRTVGLGGQHGMGAREVKGYDMGARRGVDLDGLLMPLTTHSGTGSWQSRGTAGCCPGHVRRGRRGLFAPHIDGQFVGGKYACGAANHAKPGPLAYAATRGSRSHCNSGVHCYTLACCGLWRRS